MSRPRVEVRIPEALNDIRSRRLRSGRQAAVAYNNVPASTLNRRVHSEFPKPRVGHNKKLNLQQEQALCAWLDRSISQGFSPRLDEIRDEANRLLGESGSPHKIMGQNWASRFIRRHPQYAGPRQKPRQKSRRKQAEACHEAPSQQQVPSPQQIPSPRESPLPFQLSTSIPLLTSSLQTPGSTLEIRRIVDQLTSLLGTSSHLTQVERDKVYKVVLAAQKHILDGIILHNQLEEMVKTVTMKSKNKQNARRRPNRGSSIEGDGYQVPLGQETQAIFPDMEVATETIELIQ